MLGNNSGEVVVPQLPSDATHRFEGVHVTAHESLERLAVRELDVQLPDTRPDRMHTASAIRRHRRVNRSDPNRSRNVHPPDGF